MTFPLEVNFSIALLALLAMRSRSEAQLLGLVVFALFTTMTDVVFLCSEASGWGGVMTALNMVLKLGLALHAYRICSVSDGLSADDGLGASDEGGNGGYPTAYHAPTSGLTQDDYAALAVEAADKHAAIGEVTRYRAI